MGSPCGRWTRSRSHDPQGAQYPLVQDFLKSEKGSESHLRYIPSLSHIRPSGILWRNLDNTGFLRGSKPQMEQTGFGTDPYIPTQLMKPVTCSVVHIGGRTPCNKAQFRHYTLPKA